MLQQAEPVDLGSVSRVPSHRDSRLCALLHLLCLLIGSLGCTRAIERTNHPASPILRTHILMSDIVRQRAHCLSGETVEACGITDLDVEQLRRWGQLREVGDKSARFEDYRIEVIELPGGEFCVSAIPVSRESTLRSIWKGSTFDTETYPPPWDGRPAKCANPVKTDQPRTKAR